MRQTVTYIAPPILRAAGVGDIVGPGSTSNSTLTQASVLSWQQTQLAAHSALCAMQQTKRHPVLHMAGRTRPRTWELVPLLA
jgi:hypothetical protein